jgi:mono/diheme cytochrome c family protein
MLRLLSGVIAGALLASTVPSAAQPGHGDAQSNSLATAPARGGNPAAAKITNPVAATPESVASGRRTYRRLCALCHGREGKGDGGGAGGGGVPADLTAGKWTYGSSDGEIFTVIHDGTSADMQGYSEQLSDTDIWNLVNYIRTLSAHPAR